MTVYELRQLLKGVDDNRIVVMSRDEEGNGFSPLVELDDSQVYDSTWGELHYPELTEELEAAGYGEGDIGDGEPCLVLWPAN